MAKLYRTKFDIPVIEVAGSSGKTTTKEMIEAVLNYSMPSMVGLYNLNAPMGVAINISKLREFHRTVVLEAGIFNDFKTNFKIHYVFAGLWTGDLTTLATLGLTSVWIPGAIHT